jgi:hypothetical protein
MNRRGDSFVLMALMHIKAKYHNQVIDYKALYQLKQLH